MKKVFLSLVAMLLITTPVLADITTDLNTAMNDVKTDYSAVSKWFSEQLRPGLDLNSTGGLYLPANVCHLLGFEIGVGAGVTAWNIDIKSLKSLAMNTINASEIDMLEMLALPQAVVHAKIGLPFDLDVGAKVGTGDISIDVSGSKFAFKNNLIGAEVRKKIIGGGLEGVILPDISVGVGMDILSGSLLASQRYDFVTVGEVYNGVTYKQTINSETRFITDWTINSLNVKAAISKNLIFITPFLGVGAYSNTSKVNSKVTTSGNITLETPGYPAQTTGLTVEGPGGVESTVMETGIFGGVELSIAILKININADVRQGNKYSANAGIRIEF